MAQPANEMRLAVLIDADNVPRRNIKGIITEIAIYGTPTIKRMYGDWTSPSMAGLKRVLLENAITPIQQYGYTVGKNSTDSAMIIDAMDILYSERVDGFCIVSSDSDFTRLATRLREAGKWVVGIGEKKTPNPFIVACDKFIYIEIIEQNAEAEAEEKKKEEPPAPESPHPTKDDKEEVVKLIASSIEDIADDDGYAFGGELGNLLLKKKPDFDPRSYGFKKLTPLLRSLSDYFEIDVRKTEFPNIRHIYVKTKGKKPTA